MGSYRVSTSIEALLVSHLILDYVRVPRADYSK